MPKRLLDSSYLNSPSLAKCSPGADDNWPRFVLFADDFGCFEVDARRLAVLGWNTHRADITPGVIEAWLEEYVAAGMAVLWTENERRYCYLTGWFGEHGQRKRVEYDHATVEGRKGSRRHTPRPPDALVAAVLAGARRDHDGKPPGTRREEVDEIANDSLPAREIQFPAANPVVSRRVPAHAVAVAVAVPVEACAEASSAQPPPAAEPLVLGTPPAPKPEAAAPSAAPVTDPPVVVLPCVGKGSKTYGVTQAQVDDWQAAYPGISVEAEIRKARAWLEANPARRKTSSGVPRFLVNWFTKTQNDPRNKRKVSPEDAAIHQAFLDAEREYAAGAQDAADDRHGSGPGGEGGFRAASPPLPVPGAGARVPADVSALLGLGRPAGALQDGAHVEHGAEHGSVEAPRPVRVAGTDAG